MRAIKWAFLPFFLFLEFLLHKSPRKICIFISLLKNNTFRHLLLISQSSPSPRLRKREQQQQPFDISFSPLRLHPHLFSYFSALSTVQGSIQRSLSELFTFTTFWYYVEPLFPFTGLLQKKDDFFFHFFVLCSCGYLYCWFFLFFYFFLRLRCPMSRNQKPKQ